MFNRILLVDDSKSARFALRKMLENNGYQVDMAANAEEALGYLNDNQPDVIFMDHFMPGMDGFEAASVIKNQPATAGIPIVMCTSKDDDDYIDQARAHGAVDILSKPATPRALDEVLHKLATTVDMMTNEEPVNAPEFEVSAIEPELTDSGQSTDSTINEVPAPVADIPMVDEVVVPVEEVQKIASEAAAVEINRILSGRISEVLQTKMPELRESVMANFDMVVKPLIEKYVEEALAEVKETFHELAGTEATRIAQQVSREIIDTSLQAEAQTLREDLQCELNEQLAEVYSNIGELKANQTLRKASPELMRDMLNQARDAAVEQANESLLQASEVAQETAKKITEEISEQTLEQFREDFQIQMAKTLEANLEASRQEADEVAWRKITDLQNSMGEKVGQLRIIAGCALVSALVAVGGLIYLQL